MVCVTDRCGVFDILLKRKREQRGFDILVEFRKMECHVLGS